MANHLLFEFRGTRYAIAADAVQTTFWLPELSPLEDLPAYFVGLVNLHGRVVPIVDLGLRFGYPAQPYRLDQSVVLLEENGRLLGLVADQVRDLVEIPPSSIEPYIQLEGEPPAQAPRVISGTAKWDDAVLIVLDVPALLRLVMQTSTEPLGAKETTDRFCDLSQQELDKLRQRTQRLAQLPEQTADDSNLFALVRIGSGRFAIELDHVSEFTHLGACTTIPCCPPHILGCMNLRGAILTVIDVAPLVLGQPQRDYPDVVVLRQGEHLLGLAIHQVLDIRAYPADAATALSGQAYGEQHCKTLLYDDSGAAGVLDLAALLHQGLLEVNEQI